MKVYTQSRDVLRTIQKLGIPLEGAGQYLYVLMDYYSCVLRACMCLLVRSVERSFYVDLGATLFPPESVAALLSDRRKADLIHPFRLALLQLASQEAARYANGGSEVAPRASEWAAMGKIYIARTLIQAAALRAQVDVGRGV